MLQSLPKVIPVDIKSSGIGVGLVEIEELAEVVELVKAAELVDALGLRACGRCLDSVVAFGCDVAVLHCVCSGLFLEPALCWWHISVSKSILGERIQQIESSLKEMQVPRLIEQY